MSSPSNDLHRNWLRRRSARPYCKGVAITDAGVILGASKLLAGPLGGVSDDPGEFARVCALLTAAAGKPPRSDFAAQIDAACRHWQRGDKALANLRLAFAGLPRLADEADGYRLFLAETALDGGSTPDELMKVLAPDADFRHAYNPKQPRVPAGSGTTSGRWTHASGPPPAAEERDHPKPARPPKNKPPGPLRPPSAHPPGSVPPQHTENATGSTARLCDDPVNDRGGKPKEFDRLYQEYVGSKVNPDKPIVPATKAYAFFNPVTGQDVLIDHCRDSDGALIEAKGHYDEMFDWDLGEKILEDEWVGQATRQVQAAQANGNRQVEWWFYEQRAADFAARIFGEEDALKGIVIKQFDYPGNDEWPYPPSARWAPRRDMR